jgi:hypothetical protein
VCGWFGPRKTYVSGGGAGGAKDAFVMSYPNSAMTQVKGAGPWLWPSSEEPSNGKQMAALRTDTAVRR